MANHGDKSHKILQRIQLTLSEIRDLREDSNRRHHEFTEYARRSDAKFDALIAQMNRDRERADEDRELSDRRFAALWKENRRGLRVILAWLIHECFRPPAENS